MVQRFAEDVDLGLTLAELFQFVQAADQAGLDPREPVLMTPGSDGRLLAVTVSNTRDLSHHRAT